MATEYKVEKGLDYNDKRAETGDIISDLPTSAIKSLLAIQAISVYVPEEPAEQDEEGDNSEQDEEGEE